MSHNVAPAIVGSRRAAARRGLLLFLSLVAVFNVIFTTVVVKTGNTVWFVVLMWSVALASVICRLVLREGFGDVSFRFGGRRTFYVLLGAVVFPIAIGLVAYGAAWVTGLADYQSPPRGFLGALLLAATATTAVSCLFTLGEEIGWRGYMLTRLIDAGVPRPVLVSGLIWAFWHAPLIISGAYVVNSGGSKLLGLAGFVVTVVSLAFVIARVRLETGSIWPAVVLHASWNSVIQNAFDHASAGPGAGIWLGEGGALVAGVAVIATTLAWRGRWTTLRSPGDPLR